MARQATPMKQTRTRHSQAYKDEALALAERIGVSKAAEQLGLHASQLYGWVTSPTCIRRKAGCIWQWSSICIHGW